VTEGRPVGAVVAWSSEVSFSLTLVADRLAEDELMGHFVCQASSAGRRGAWASFNNFVGAAE